MCRLFLMTFACLLVLFGISGLWMMPKIVNQKIEQQMQLKMGSKFYQRFQKVPIPLTVKMYIFNVTNSERVLAGHERPQFAQVGPFVYKQWRRRDVIDFEDYNRRLRYREYKTYLPDYLDNRELLDPRKVNVTIVNIALLTVLTRIAQMEEDSMKRSLATRVLGRLIQEGGDKLLITKPASQILFDGFKVDYLEAARNLVSNTLGFNFESPLPKNKFGFFYGKNDTWNRKLSGEFTVFTGRNDSIRNYLSIDNWNDAKELQVWPSNSQAGNICNQIKGSDGSQFPPGVSKSQVLNIFTPLICTSVELKFKEETETKGIPLYRFAPASDMFAAPRKNPRKACYCTVAPTKAQVNASRTITDARCYLDGLLDLSLCQRGAPVAASWPHFYAADPLLAMASGLKPEARLHETFVDVEPMTGTVFRAGSRAQMNAYVEQAAISAIDSSIIGQMTPMVAPLIWLEETAEIDEPKAAEFKGKLLSVVRKAHRTFVYSIVIGIILALATALQYWYVTCYRLDAGHTRRRQLKGEPGAGGRKKPTGGRLQANIRQAATSSAAKAGSEKLQPAADDGRPESDLPADIVVPVLTAAAAMGAATVAPQTGRNKSRRKRKATYEEEEEDEMSKQMLVAAEWDVAESTPKRQNSSCVSSSQSIEKAAPGKPREPAEARTEEERIAAAYAVQQSPGASSASSSSSSGY